MTQINKNNIIYLNDYHNIINNYYYNYDPCLVINPKIELKYYSYSIDNINVIGFIIFNITNIDGNVEKIIFFFEEVIYNLYDQILRHQRNINININECDKNKLENYDNYNDDIIDFIETPFITPYNGYDDLHKYICNLYNIDLSNCYIQMYTYEC